jgi:hypothetical protein
MAQAAQEIAGQRPQTAPRPTSSRASGASLRSSLRRSGAVRGLAILQIFNVTASVVERFEVVMVEGFKEGAIFDGVQDRVTAGVPKVEFGFVTLTGEGRCSY